MMNQEIDYQQEIDNITKWMKKYIEVSGTKGFVVGLSGGLDSSVIACLAVQAVGKENVIGISLPCQTRQDMKTDAKKLAKNLGIRFETIKLDKSVGFLADGIKMTSTEVKPIVLANIKARLRMTALYAMAGANNYIVVGTGNLSEIVIGYFTKFGDGGVDIEPIGNYYKTEVYKMAKLLPEIPNGAITKAPSADLWDGQTDEEEIGMTYKQLDKILMALDANKMSEIDKFEIEDIEKVRKMILIAEHKNNLPPKYKRE